MQRSLAPWVLVALVGCAGDDGITALIDGPPAPIDARVDAVPIDAPTDATPVCSVSTTSFGDRGALVPSECFQSDSTTPLDNSDDVIYVRAPLEPGSPFDELELQLWAGYAPFENGFRTGVFPLVGDQLQYNTCGVCVLVQTDQTDPDTYAHDYFATGGGTVTLTSVNGVLTGTVQNVILEHVTIDDSGSTPVDDGCVTAIGRATFTAPLEFRMMNP